MLNIIFLVSECLCNGSVPTRNGSVPTRNGTCLPQQSLPTVQPQKNYEADHTVLSGVCIDWGHGWGWGQNAILAQQSMLCGHEAALSALSQVPASSIFCHSADDYAVAGMDEVDWCAFGDFSF